MNLREAEANSIIQFVGQAALDGYFSGRVLDYGCGKQPYRGIVEAAGGQYDGFDQADFPANVSGVDVLVEDEELGSQMPYEDYDAVLCTQVIQYVPNTHDFFIVLRSYISQKKGVLVMTYPTNWPEVEQADLHRFTKAGMERLFSEAGFTIERHEWRHGFRSPSGESFAAGYGIIGRA